LDCDRLGRGERLFFVPPGEIESAGDEYDNRRAKENNPNASHRVSDDKVNSACREITL
jgi:hypothetical protein